MTFYIAGFWLLLIVLTAFAWLGRDRPTIRPVVVSQPQLPVTAMFWTAAVLTILMRSSPDARFIHTEHSLLLIDFGLFGALTWAGVRSGRGWVMCAAAFQLISATAHLARLVTPGMFRLGYQVMEEASSYPTLALLAYGILRHLAARRRTICSRTSSG